MSHDRILGLGPDNYLLYLVSATITLYLAKRQPLSKEPKLCKRVTRTILSYSIWEENSQRPRLGHGTLFDVPVQVLVPFFKTSEDV